MCDIPFDRFSEAGRGTLRQHEFVSSARRGSMRGSVGCLYMEAQLVFFVELSALSNRGDSQLMRTIVEWQSHDRRMSQYEQWWNTNSV